MNTQTTIRARRVNNNTKPLGEHFTLTRVVNDSIDQKFFGFAMTDEGEEVYIPASIVRGQQMTEHDVGAGFTCVAKANTGYTADRNHRVCIPPLKWDGDVEEIQVNLTPDETPVSNGDLEAVEADLQALADGADNMCVETAQQLREAIADIDNLSIRDAKVKMGRVADTLEGFRATIDEIVPENEDG